MAARALSGVGDEIALIALTLRLQGFGARPYEIAALLAAGMLPMVVLAPLVGRIVDSVDSRRLLVCTTLVEAACCLPLAVVRSVPLLLGFALLLGIAVAFTVPNWQALVPSIVGEENIGRATAASQSVFTMASIAAPAAGGLLAGAFGTRVPLLADAASFALMTVAALAIGTRRTARRADSSAGAGAAWTIMRGDPLLGPLVAGLAAFVLLGMMVNVVQVFLVRETLHSTAAWYGAIEATWMLGTVGGCVAAGRFGTDGRRAAAIVAGAGLMAAAFIGFGTAPSVLVLVPVSVAGGIGNGLVNVCVATLVMTRTPEAMRGRASAVLSGAVNAAAVVSLVAGGALAAIVSPRGVYLLAGVLCIAVAGALAARGRLVWRRRLGVPPAPAARSRTA